MKYFIKFYSISYPFFPAPNSISILPTTQLRERWPISNLIIMEIYTSLLSTPLQQDLLLVAVLKWYENKEIYALIQLPVLILRERIINNFFRHYSWKKYKYIFIYSFFHLFKYKYEEAILSSLCKSLRDFHISMDTSVSFFITYKLHWGLYHNFINGQFDNF